MVVISIEVYNDLITMKVDQLSSLLLPIEQKRKKMKEILEHAFTTNVRIMNNNFIGHGHNKYKNSSSQRGINQIF